MDVDGTTTEYPLKRGFSLREASITRVSVVLLKRFTEYPYMLLLTAYPNIIASSSLERIRENGLSTSCRLGGCGAQCMWHRPFRTLDRGSPGLETPKSWHVLCVSSFSPKTPRYYIQI